jgi:hypothetical protein
MAGVLHGSRGSDGQEEQEPKRHAVAERQVQVASVLVPPSWGCSDQRKLPHAAPRPERCVQARVHEGVFTHTESSDDSYRPQFSVDKKTVNGNAAWSSPLMSHTFCLRLALSIKPEITSRQPELSQLLPDVQEIHRFFVKTKYSINLKASTFKFKHKYLLTLIQMQYVPAEDYVTNMLKRKRSFSAEWQSSSTYGVSC